MSAIQFYKSRQASWVLKYRLGVLGRSKLTRSLRQYDSLTESEQVGVVIEIVRKWNGITNCKEYVEI